MSLFIEVCLNKYKIILTQKQEETIEPRSDGTPSKEGNKP